MTLLLGLGWNGGTAEDGGGAVVGGGAADAVGCAAGAEEVWKNLLASSFRLGGAAEDVAAVEAFDGVGEGAAVDDAAVDEALDCAGNVPNALGAAGASFVGGGVPAEPFTTGGTTADAAAEGPEEPFASIVPKLKPEFL
jgi:hypothetical protein